MRTTSAAAKEALYSPQTAQVFVDLLTIDHADLDEPYRLCNDLKAITSRGNTYSAFAFSAQYPPDAEGELPRLDFVVDNVDRLLVVTVRGIRTPPSFVLETVLASSPDVVEAGPFSFDATQVEYDTYRMKFSLGYEALANEPFPEGIYSPQLYPALFQAVDK